MTLAASHPGMFARQWEYSGIMIKDAILPASRYVAGRTIRPKLAIMVVILCMAGKTSLGSSFKNIALMTGIATQFYMVANERKCSGIVIEFCSRPFCGLMACTAIFTELAFVDIFCRMAGKTIPGRVFVYPIDMAGFTADIDV